MPVANPKAVETMPLLPEPADLRTVHRAGTEFEAMTIRDLLEAAGIKVMVRSRQVPGYAVTTMAGDQAGIWGDILVLPGHEAAARQAIAEYLASLRAGVAEDESQ